MGVKFLEKTSHGDTELTEGTKGRIKQDFFRFFLCDLCVHRAFVRGIESNCYE